MHRKEKQRRLEMFKMFREGRTLNQIGISFGVSRERVRQLITKFPKYTEIIGENRKKRKVPEPRIVSICQQCNKKTIRKYTRKFCSHFCLELFRNKGLDLNKEKWCNKCKTIQDISNFYYKKIGKKKQSYCKKCHLKICNDWKSRNIDRVRIIAKRSSERYHKKLKENPELYKKYLELTRSYYWKKKNAPITEAKKKVKKYLDEHPEFPFRFNLDL